MTFTHLTRTIRSEFGVLRNPQIRRFALTLSLSETTGPAYATALFVFAFQAGGAGAVGLVALCTMLPAGALAPFAALLADRGRRSRVAAGASAARSILLFATAAAMLAGLPLAAVTVLAALASIASRLFYPAQMSLLPRLTRDEDELVTANALGSAIENLGSVAGPAFAGALLFVVNPPAVVLLCALAGLATAAVAMRIAEPPVTPEGRETRIVAELLAGWAAVARIRTLRVVISVFAFQTAVFGVLSVVIVELAIAEFRIGNGGVGLLDGALGIGGVLGGLVTVSLASRLRLGASLRLGTILWGAPLAFIAVEPTLGAALLLLVVVGVGNVLVDVSAYTLIQRATPDALRGRVFGALEGAAVAAVALGSLLGGIGVTTLGTRWVLALAGLSLPSLALLAWRTLGSLDPHELPAPAGGAEIACAQVA